MLALNCEEVIALKTKIIKFVTLLLVFILAVGVISSVSAAKYVAKPVLEKFETQTLFLAPGDMDSNGKVDSLDFSELREMLLLDAANRFSDVNGDEITNICDLVLQNENVNKDFISGGKMNLNGKSIYNKEIKSSLNAGAEYKITYSATGDVKVKLEGIDGLNVTASGNTFKTPLNLSNNDIELCVIGNGTIDELSIVRVNMDNDYAIK